MSLLTEIAGRFQTVETGFNLVLPDPAQVAQANPARYAIGFAHIIGGTAVVTTNSSLNTVSGFTAPLSGIQWFTVKDHGPFAQSAWYVRSSSGGTILTVFEVIDNEG